MLIIKTQIYQILKNTSELSIGKGKTAEDKQAFQSGLAILQNVYNEPATLINEVTPGTFDTFWERMKPLFNDGVAENTEIKNRFLKENNKQARYRHISSKRDVAIRFTFFYFTKTPFFQERRWLGVY